MDNEWKIRLISLPYNIEDIISDFNKSGLYSKGFWWSKCIVKTLQTGINYSSICHEEAARIAALQNEKLGEKHWDLAAEKLRILEN